jgi:hypothetical protein
MIDRRRDLLKIGVELSGILPPIWREILVPATYSFWDLHVGIQDAMGWLDYRLHEFRIKDRGPGNSTIIGIPPEELWEDQLEVPPGWEIPVTGYLFQPGDQAEYEYDFGDGWLHLVTLVSVEPRGKGKRYPQCIAGARACGWRILTLSTISDSCHLLHSGTNITLGRHERSLLPTFPLTHHHRQAD